MWNLLEKETDGENYDYIFFPCNKKAFKLKLRVAQDAQIVLTNETLEGPPICQIGIGEWQNTIVSYSKNGSTECEIPLIGLVDGSEFRELWLSWRENRLAVGKCDNRTPFLFWEDSIFESFSHAGIRTINVNGSWIIDNDWDGWEIERPIPSTSGTPIWVACSDGVVPPDAVEGGHDNEEVLYIGRAMHNNALTPGKVVKSQKACLISWGGKEHEKTEYEVLSGCTPTWVEVTNKEVPLTTLKGGYSEWGEPLFIGRVKYDNAVVPGKVHLAYEFCHIPYHGKEIEAKQYEVLVL